MNKTVYADNAATTALSETAFEAMLPYSKTEYGNRLTLIIYSKSYRRLFSVCGNCPRYGTQ